MRPLPARRVGNDHRCSRCHLGRESLRHSRRFCAPRDHRPTERFRRGVTAQSAHGPSWPPPRRHTAPPERGYSTVQMSAQGERGVVFVPALQLGLEGVQHRDHRATSLGDGVLLGREQLDGRGERRVVEGGRGRRCRRRRPAVRPGDARAASRPRGPRCGPLRRARRPAARRRARIGAEPVDQRPVDVVAAARPQLGLRGSRLGPAPADAAATGTRARRGIRRDAHGASPGTGRRDPRRTRGREYGRSGGWRGGSLVAHRAHPTAADDTSTATPRRSADAQQGRVRVDGGAAAGVVLEVQVIDGRAGVADVADHRAGADTCAPSP